MSSASTRPAGKTRRTLRITATGVWTPPSGVNEVEAIIIGGGAGGGGGGAGLFDNTNGSTASSGSVGGAGGAGAYARRVTIPVTPGQMMPVIVGSGGAGGAGGTAVAAQTTANRAELQGGSGSTGSPGTASVFGGIRVPGAASGGLAGAGAATNSNQISGLAVTAGTPLAGAASNAGGQGQANPALTSFGGASPGGGVPNTNSANQFSGYHATMRAGYNELLGPFAPIELAAYAQAGGGGGGGANGAGVNTYDTNGGYYVSGPGGAGFSGEASYGGPGGLPLQATLTGSVTQQISQTLINNYVRIQAANINSATPALVQTIARGIDAVAATAPGAGGGGGGGAGTFRGNGLVLANAVANSPGGAGAAGGPGIVILTWEE